MRSNKKYSLLLVGIIVLSFVAFQTLNHLNTSIIHSHEHEDDLNSSYNPCDCEHNRCTGNIATCPCCGTGAPTTINPTSYSQYGGSTVSGNLASTYYDDLDYLIVEAGYIWWFGFHYSVTFYFEFTNTECDRIQVDVRDNAPNYNMMAHVYYTTGNPDHLPEEAGGWPNGWLSDGYYTFTIDDSRYLDYISINFYTFDDDELDRYLKVDLCVAEPI